MALMAALAVAAAGLLSAQRGDAARRPVAKPGASLFGLVLQGYSHPVDAGPLKTLNPDTVRILLTQPQIQTGSGACTAAGGACNWSAIDQEIGGAAQAGADPLPFLFGDQTKKPPVTSAALAGWTQFVKAAVGRYGPGGVYWQGTYQAQYPGAAARVVNTWQVWNEPGSPTYFKPKPNVGAYIQLLRASDTAIHSVDSHAKIMLAGLFSSADKGAIRGRLPAVQYLQKLYDAGAQDLFDIVAVHPYARRVPDLISQIKQIRTVMKKNGDARTPLAITELGWSSNKNPGSLLAVGSPAAQAKQLRSAFSQLLRIRRSARLSTVDWFSLRDAPQSQSSCPNCPYAGLLQVDGTPKPAFNAFKSFTG